MVFFNLRSKRVAVEFPVRIYLQNKDSGKISNIYRSGTLVSISKGGGCLVVDKVILDGDHLFFNTQEQSDNYLVLKGNEELEDHLSALCTSIWMDGFTHKKRTSFKIGVKFIGDQKDLFTLCKTIPSKTGSA